MNKITIIGAGSVGSTIAYTLMVSGLSTEIVMIDINLEKASGEALDIRQGIPFGNPGKIYDGTYSDAVGSDIVIITSGIARKPGQTRLDLAQTNINITKSIIPEITRYAPDAIYLIVSNPVDILTYTFCKCSGLPENRIIGSGTILDTSRLRASLSEHFEVSQTNVHGYVLGEHGDSLFIPWSLVNISNIDIEECHEVFQTPAGTIKPVDYAKIEEYVRKSGGKVIEAKGATFYAVSMSVCHICKCILSGVDTTMTVSNMMHGEYGLEDVCLSTLCVVGKNGIRNKVVLPLNEEEMAKLHKSADTLKDIINNTTI